MGKQSEIRVGMWGSHQLGSYERAAHPCKMEERVQKVRKVDTRVRMLWVVLDTGEDLWETVEMWMCWTCCLCLYRKTIIEPLGQAIMTEIKISGITIKAVYNDPITLSRSGIRTEKLFSFSHFSCLILYSDKQGIWS